VEDDEGGGHDGQRRAIDLGPHGNGEELAEANFSRNGPSCCRMSDNEKDLEILILRHQLDILERKQKRLVRPNRAEKLILAVLTARLKQATNRPCGGYLSHSG
jgi:hypothetical protein